MELLKLSPSLNGLAEEMMPTCGYELLLLPYER
jgi:hypothetical protein